MSWIDDHLGVFIFIIIICSLFCLSQIMALLRCKKGPKFVGSHVLISGGSKGIGKELAHELVRSGAKVSILSRNQTDLDAAVSSMRSSSPTHGEIRAFSADVTDVSSLQNAINAAVDVFGPIDILIPCAGLSLTGKILDRSLDDFRRSMELNYMGTVNLTYLILPSMMKRKQGSICFIGSALSLTSYIGYATYTPTKYAIRGFADTLRNELLPFNVSVHIAYPMNVRTPGFEQEEKTKPEECKAIEASDPVFEPQVVAHSILQSLEKGDFNIYCGNISGMMLGIICGGMSPRVNIILDAILLPFVTIVAWIVRTTWDREVVKEKYLIHVRDAV